MGKTARATVTVAAVALLVACQQGPDIGEADLDLRQWTEADDPAASITLHDGRSLWITGEAATIREDVDVALHPSPDGGQQVVVTSPEETMIPDEQPLIDERDSEFGLLISPLSRMAEDPEIEFSEPPLRYLITVAEHEATPVRVVPAEIQTVCIELMGIAPARYPLTERSTVPSGLAQWTVVGHSEREVELACGGPAPDAPIRDNDDWAAEQTDTQLLERSADRIDVDLSRDVEAGTVSLEIASSSPMEIQAPTGDATLAGVAGTGIWYWDPDAERLPAEDGLTLEISLDENSPLWWDFREVEICLAVYPTESDEPGMHCTEFSWN